MNFKEIVPGVFVNTGRANISIPHPNPCIILEVEVDGKNAPLGDVEERAIYVFSSTEAVELFTTDIDIKAENVVAVPISWDGLVDRFGGPLDKALVDPRPKLGYAEIVPLRKDI